MRALAAPAAANSERVAESAGKELRKVRRFIGRALVVDLVLHFYIGNRSTPIPAYGGRAAPFAQQSIHVEDNVSHDSITPPCHPAPFASSFPLHMEQPI